ncbi:hypothetical protein, partial [Aestuariibaculum lutulentum]
TLNLKVTGSNPVPATNAIEHDTPPLGAALSFMAHDARFSIRAVHPALLHILTETAVAAKSSIRLVSPYNPTPQCSLPLQHRLKP